MSQDQAPGGVIDQLRANLRAVGIQPLETDIQGMIEKGFLSRVAAFEQTIDRVPGALLPDYLGQWGFSSGATSEARPVPPSRAPIQSPAASGAVKPGRATLDVAPIGAIATLLRTRQISPVELTRRALEQINRHDQALNAFQHLLAEDALASAQRAEEEIAAGAYRGPLHGVPVAVKDLLMMAGTPTTAGSSILAGWKPEENAAAVERLAAAGAVIVGKTRLSEFAYSPGSNNAHYGPTRNPWNGAHDSGGSSSGSAVAVAAGLVYGAVGTDTGGSIRIPATLCGIVGLKPTYGRCSLHGVVPLSWSLDHLGPLARSVADAAILLSALAGDDARDERTRLVSRFSIPPNLEASIAGIRVGVVRDDGSGTPSGTAEALEARRVGLAALERRGAELVEVDVPELEGLRLLIGAILAMEASAYHLNWLRERLGDYGEFMRQRILAAFAYRPSAFVRAQQARAALRRACDALFARIDLLATPAQPDVAPQLGTPASTYYTGPFNLLGWPAITIPTGLSATGLPLSIQLAGRPWDEPILLSAGHAIETEIGRFIPPQPDD
jgi:aspartyl-tRNA(Asn)/glutamyl-tRNA(Gln) amidotransferase subunit A